jgi:hypothetical protein
MLAVICNCIQSEQNKEYHNMSTNQNFLVHRLPLFDVALAEGAPQRLSWEDLMRSGQDSWGRWILPEQSLILAQCQLLAGLLSWGARASGLSWNDLAESLKTGGATWQATVEQMALALDEEATSLTDPNQALLQMPASWVEPDTGIEGLLAPFTITPGGKAKAFHIRRERIHQLCPGCAAQALIRLHTNSAQRAQYWSETPLGRGAIAWTAHLNNESESEHIVGTALINCDLDAAAATGDRPGWATDPATGEPWVTSLVKRHEQGQTVNLGFPLLPMTRSIRLGAFTETDEACDLCQAVGPVVKTFGLLPEPATFAKIFNRKKSAGALPAEKKAEDGDDKEEVKAAKMFMRLGAPGQRHPWTILQSRPSREEGKAPAIFAQSIQEVEGIKAPPDWSYLGTVLSRMSHEKGEADMGSPVCLRRLAEVRLLLQSKGTALREIIRAFSTKPAKNNPNLASFLNTSFDLSRLESQGEKTNLSDYLTLLNKAEGLVVNYRDAWIDMGAEVLLASRQTGESNDKRFKNRPLNQIAHNGVKSMKRDKASARFQAMQDPLLISAVHQAWELASQTLGEYLEQKITEGQAHRDIDEQLFALGKTLPAAWKLRTDEVRDWARISHAVATYCKACFKFRPPSTAAEKQP